MRNLLHLAFAFSARSPHPALPSKESQLESHVSPASPCAGQPGGLASGEPHDPGSAIPRVPLRVRERSPGVASERLAIAVTSPPVSQVTKGNAAPGDGRPDIVVTTGGKNR
ncbi:hypothetical protein SKAU_G00256990 [Synaphobranchus kaupii]|uniref:Uncharacterized protein n=1 Tax=Synaphobranchus kaupii TaxID=118154 RepID=A0A9Q1IQC5_SYNKA|nr:hypothetical protein SKAU_G00256990 [Synaphobranchus kaupii]